MSSQFIYYLHTPVFLMWRIHQATVSPNMLLLLPHPAILPTPAPVIYLRSRYFALLFSLLQLLLLSLLFHVCLIDCMTSPESFLSYPAELLPLSHELNPFFLFPPSYLPVSSSYSSSSPIATPISSFIPLLLVLIPLSNIIIPSTGYLFC